MKTIVITGGAKGIGRCLVEYFASQGNTVYFIDMDVDAVATVTEKLCARQMDVHGFTGDIADEQVLQKFAERVIEETPQGIHCLINNACLMKGGILSGCSYEDFLYVQRVGVAAPYLLSKLFMHHFAGLGSIVNLSSTRAFQSQPDTEAYTAAKGGITALTHALAVSLSGIARVNAIAPGWIDTGKFHDESYVPDYTEGDIMQHPSQRVGEPGDIARAVEFLCDERNSFINGQCITIDGGMSKLMVYHNDCGWKKNKTVINYFIKILMLLQLLFVLVAIIIGARVGGIGLGILGGLGLAVLTFVFGLQPTAPPIDVMLMIVAVIAAASCMQAAGGLDLMVKWAEKILRKNPHHITLLSPFVTYFFTFFAGTGHVAYSVLPVIAEVAKDTGIRPERPLGIAVIASQQAITASPISAATVAMLSMLAGYNISLFDILKISIPCTLIGVLLGALYSMRVGKELKDDPEYQRRLAAGEISGDGYHTAEVASYGKALTSVILFLAATIGIVLFGSIDGLRPTFATAQGEVQMEMSHIIEILMLSAASLILLLTKTDGIKAAKCSVFNAGMQAVVAIFGIAWMGDTFIAGNMEVMKENIFGLVTDMPWLFGVALFLMSILLFSQAATVRSLLPLGIALGISPYMLIALFPAVNGYFFLPNYPTVIAAINFDTTGTTRIGKYLLNHSFMMPGLIATIVSVVLGIVWVSMM